MMGRVRRSHALVAALAAAVLIASPAAAELGFDLTSAAFGGTSIPVANVAERGARVQATAPAAPPSICFERRVFVIGDSLTVGAVDFGDLGDALRAGDYVARVDARQSRFSDGGANRLRIEAAAGRLEPIVVVALGTNDAGARFTTEWFAGNIDSVMAAVGRSRTVLWVNLQVRDTEISDRFNAVLAFKAVQYPNLYILDWSSVGNRDDLASDGLHYDPIGYHQRTAFTKDQLDLFTCRRLPF